ncbi:MAG TPA: LamG domain-containing protein, partial [Dehalococcoidia bacterium]|nr:LamG domain-containing protein [Dehalococcoidia bacterium]
AVTFSPNATNASKSTTATFTRAGTYALRATIRDASSQTVTSDVSVIVDQTFSSIIVAPLTASVPAGTTKQYTAQAIDQFGIAMTAQPSFTWSVSGGGSISASGLFTAGATAGGPFTVTATSGAISGAATLSVTSAGGLVAAYSFNEASGKTVNDASGQGNKGTIAGPSRINAGKYGKALNFDGINDQVDINDSNSLDLTNGMTLEAWVRPTASGGWRTIVLKEQTGGLVYALYGNTSLNKPSGELATAAGGFDTNGTAALALNTWTHLATTYDGSVLSLYVNGVLVSSRTVGGAIMVSTGKLRIGGNAIWGEFYKGRIDEVRIYSRALSAAEISADMNTPLP